jgi:HPt (histidine-containing phosphotransfer) domain-containing protein
MINKTIKLDKIETEKPLDVELILEEFDGNKNLFFEVIGRFLNKAKKQLDSIRQAIHNKDIDLIIFEAHSIKGGASNLRAYKLANLAYQLEKFNLIQASSTGKNLEICQQLEVSLNSLELYILELMSKERE